MGASAVVITLKRYGDAGWYWNVRDDEVIVGAGWAGTLPGAWWRANRVRRRAPHLTDDQG